jgi:hypothetical protein
MSVTVAVSAHLLDLALDFIDFLVTSLATSHHLVVCTDTSLAGGDRHDAYQIAALASSSYAELLAISVRGCSVRILLHVGSIVVLLLELLSINRVAGLFCLLHHVDLS